MKESIQDVKHDILPLSVGGSFLGFTSFADATVFVQQIGIWFGTILVIVTLGHRIWKWWTDAHK